MSKSFHSSLFRITAGASLFLCSLSKLSYNNLSRFIPIIILRFSSRGRSKNIFLNSFYYKSNDCYVISGFSINKLCFVNPNLYTIFTQIIKHLLFIIYILYINHAKNILKSNILIIKFQVGLIRFIKHHPI